jgi:hypothetical protein
LKVCTRCRESKSLDLMAKQRVAPDGRSSWCKACVASLARVWRAKNRERHRESVREWVKRNPERAAEARRARERRQSHSRLPAPTRPEPAACEACGKKRATALCLDHCHKTDKFRGWLCSKCNAGLGILGDDAASVRRVLAYVERAEGQ